MFLSYKISLIKYKPLRYFYTLSIFKYYLLIPKERTSIFHIYLSYLNLSIKVLEVRLLVRTSRISFMKSLRLTLTRREVTLPSSHTRKERKKLKLGRYYLDGSQIRQVSLYTLQMENIGYFSLPLYFCYQYLSHNFSDESMKRKLGLSTFK